jgi:NADH-quinone oxidoreductase subunit H
MLQIMFEIFIFPGFTFLLLMALFLHWLERKLIARFQGRIGPPWYQPVADLVKLFSKEDTLPVGTNSCLPHCCLGIFRSVLTASFYLPIAVQTLLLFRAILCCHFFIEYAISLVFSAGWIQVEYIQSVGEPLAAAYFSMKCFSVGAQRHGNCGWIMVAGGYPECQLASVRIFFRKSWIFLGCIGLIGKLKREPYDIPMQIGNDSGTPDRI